MKDKREWLEADGLGGFASGTVSGPRARRYHALLCAAVTPPTGRFVLVNGFDAWLETSAGTYALSSQAYPNHVEYPNGSKRLEAFEPDPWPAWTYRCEDGVRVTLELFAVHGAGGTCLSFRAPGKPSRATLTLRPFLSGRDYHSLHRENGAFRFDAEAQGDRLTFSPYPGVPAFVLWSNGQYRAQPDWYRQFVYAAEAARGLDAVEDLASPGTLTFDLAREPAVLLLATQAQAQRWPRRGALDAFEELRDREAARRKRFASRLHRSADAYLVERGEGRTLIAGYPWFTDWGRDTFISLRGVCLATGRLAEARAILLQWASAVSQGMLPNRFADGDAPEFNAVDASLWFVVAVHEYLGAAARARQVDLEGAAKLGAAVAAILQGYAAGTRHGIRADRDGLLAAGERGFQLTWMDARVGDRVVTPRIGKPVEVQALWLNALEMGAALDAAGSERWLGLLAQGKAAFAERFWNPERRCLFDVVDVDHRAGAVDASVRPNQLFAVGGLPFPILDGERARAVVDVVEAALWTPMGLRTLAPNDPAYVGRYRGGPVERDGAYHQGTAWPWLVGPLVEAWARVRGDTKEARREARERFLPGLVRHLDEAGIGHVSEVADGDAPHTPGGCPFQAWSVAELLRVSDSAANEVQYIARP